MSNLIGYSTGTSVPSCTCVYFLIFVSNATLINFVPFLPVNFGSVFSGHTVLSLSATNRSFIILRPSASILYSVSWPVL